MLFHNQPNCHFLNWKETFIISHTFIFPHLRLEALITQGSSKAVHLGNSEKKSSFNQYFILIKINTYNTSAS